MTPQALWSVFHLNTLTLERVRFEGVGDLAPDAARARASDINIGRGRGSYTTPSVDWCVMALPVEPAAPSDK